MTKNIKIKVDTNSNTIADDICAQIDRMTDDELFDLSSFASMMPVKSYYDLADAIETA
jgi:hypothetical protein